MVGTEVLFAALSEPRIGSLTAIVRRPLGLTDLPPGSKLREIVHSDLTDYSALGPVLAETDLWFYCVGVYQGMVPANEFYRVTCDYLAALLGALGAVRRDATLCLFSAQGADPTERSRILFARAKGKAERLLAEAGLARTFVFRPGYIDPGRKRAKSRIPVWFARPFYRLIPALGIDAADLARVMVHCGVHGSDRRLFENRDLRREAARLRAARET